MVTPKELSIGEFDVRSGLTFVTLQRGRLMFNMGPPSTKRAAPTKPTGAAPAETSPHTNPTNDGGCHAVEAPLQPPQHTSSVADTTVVSPPLLLASPPRQRVFRSGVFTGRVLYAEETVYLVQRGALVVFEMEEVSVHETRLDTTDQSRRDPLTLAQLIAIVVTHRCATLAMLDVYTFLKDNKLHPRRHGVASQPPQDDRELALFDVFKTVTATEYMTVDATADAPMPEQAISLAVLALPSVPPSTKTLKRKVKRLALIFRAVVSSFRDPAPRPRALRRLLDTAMPLVHDERSDTVTTITADREAVPLKLAVADADRSVLLFEVA